jgi:LCP family protein required for cell wall assembly
MTDEELPEEADPSDAEDAPDLPPPSTFAGKARKAEEEDGDEGASGLTEEFDGLEAELSADLGDKAPEGADQEADPADEQEEPPDEFAFEEEEADEPDAEDESDSEAAAPQISGATIEADTLALSDIEAQREAAHAGLAKRAEKSTFSHQVTTGSHKVQPPSLTPPVVAAADKPEEDEGVGAPPKRRIGWRFMAAAFVIVSSVAAATAVSFLLFLSDIAEGLNDDGTLGSARAQLDNVEGGGPQTILILGSDKRDSTPTDPGRSDTAMLLRVDPDKNFLALMSLPRDLSVPIPGYGPENKLNAAYSYGEQAKPGGGPELAIQTIKEYLDIPINHVVNIDFRGFYEAVNAIDCAYIDVDHHYFHSNEGVVEGSEDFYSEIDVQAGYQKLCGYKALQYVRYRHGDSDLVRGTRQQEFIREARQRIPPKELLPVFGTGNELIDIFKEYTSSDIDDPGTIVEMMKTFIEVREAPVRQVSIGEIVPSGGVEATPDQVDAAVNQFLGNDLDDAPAEEPAEAAPEDGGSKPKDEQPKPEPEPPTALIDSTATALELAAGFEQFMGHHDSDLPIFYPTKIVGTTNAAISTEDSRAAALEPPEDVKDVFAMYKYVIPFFDPNQGTTYYGVSGTDWLDPPILKNPSTTKTIDGREYLLYYEKDQLRLVGWHTSKGSYWVSNTLSRGLTEEQMLGVAAATRELGE